MGTGFKGLDVEKWVYIHVTRHRCTWNTVTETDVNQTSCDRNRTGVAPHHEQHLQYNICIWQQSEAFSGNLY